MNPSSVISHSALPEMWHFPMAPAIRDAKSVMSYREISAGESTVTEQSCGLWSRNKRQDPGLSSSAASEDESNSLDNSETMPMKEAKFRSENGQRKADAEVNSTGNKADQLLEPPKQDYIQVRARRGQATDSHSLAERARRDKISERMKILQDLVPGCNKVIGKAAVLDEIINYIQALQRQVELLSMKFEAINSRTNYGMEVFRPKDFGAQTYQQAPSNMGFSSQPTRKYENQQGSTAEWLHMQVGGTFQRVT